jgi:hypothetical protein
VITPPPPQQQQQQQQQQEDIITSPSRKEEEADYGKKLLQKTKSKDVQRAYSLLWCY